MPETVLMTQPRVSLLGAMTGRVVYAVETAK